MMQRPPLGQGQGQPEGHTQGQPHGQTRASRRPRAYAPDPAAPAGRGCDMPGCPHAGGYRAPKSRHHLNDYHWFCLDHVRAYNAGWDFYKGMTPADIEAQLRSDTGWQRPTWPLGSLGHTAWDDDVLRDPLHILASARVNQARRTASEAPAELREPLATLGLSWPTTLDAVKTRYKELAKRHHPDANGGSRAAEERLKVINLAYAAVRSRLGTEARAGASG